MSTDRPDTTENTALALMPFVKFPTADDDLGNEHVEGGLILPLSVELPPVPPDPPAPDPPLPPVPVDGGVHEPWISPAAT